MAEEELRQKLKIEEGGKKEQGRKGGRLEGLGKSACRGPQLSLPRTPGRKGKKTEGAPTDSKGEGYPEVLAQCLNLVNKQLKKASLTLGVAFKGKLSRPAIDELKVVHKGGESLRKALSALAMKKNLDKNEVKGVARKAQLFMTKMNKALDNLKPYTKKTK